MTRKEIWGDFFKKTVIPVLLALILFYTFKTIFTKDGVTNYFMCGFAVGFPSVFAGCSYGLCRMGTTQAVPSGSLP